MESNKWYIKEQCEKIRDDAEIIDDMTKCPDIWKLLQKIIVSAYKIEADVLGKDLKDLVDQ